MPACSFPIPAVAQRLAPPAALAPDQCRSLLDCLAQIADPRHRRGRRHALGAVLAVAVAAVLTGGLSWQYMESPATGTGNVLLLVPGTVAVTKGLPMVNPLGKEVEIPIGLVELTAAEVTVCLSDVLQAVARFAGRLERAAATAFAALPADAVDEYVTLDLPLD